jgi:hypothetical protein
MLSIPELRKVLELKVWIVQAQAHHETVKLQPMFGLLKRALCNDELVAQADDALRLPYEHLSWTITLLERELGFEVTPENIQILAERETRMTRNRKLRTNEKETRT